MSFALVFFLHCRTRDVILVTDIREGTEVGAVTKARWNGRMYKAKVLYIGPKELCEVKAPNVTEEGELVDTPFDVSRSSLLLDEESSSNTRLNTSMEEEQMRFNKEGVTRLIKVEESVGLLKDLVVQMYV
ncbi:unnamed protein product [Heligmosomoides polygyrus]|uniref:KOW domain-containing protein n=1 Tax=Heligmosomoides polygyrus TaxID=6339 RepID=A0A183FU58_HELPZ|nr:unnamed protein product [Heligmosomoides polygyrus]